MLAPRILVTLLIVLAAESVTSQRRRLCRKAPAPTCPKTCPNPCPNKDEDKIWVFGYVTNGHRQNLNGENELSGISHQLVQAVCDEAGKKCRHILLPKAEMCWDPETQFSSAVMLGMVDGCAIMPRIRAAEPLMDFSGAFYNPKNPIFWRKAGTKYIPDETSGRVGLSHDVCTWDDRLIVVYFENFHGDCFDRVIKKAGLKPQRVHKLSYTDALASLLTGNEGVKFMVASYEVLSRLSDTSIIEAVPEWEIPCVSGPDGVMHRVDSKVGKWFPTAFETLKKDGTLGSICKSHPKERGCDLLGDNDDEDK